MNWSVLDVVFLMTLVILALIPNRKWWRVLLIIVLGINLCIGVHYIRKSYSLEEEMRQIQQLAQAPVLTLTSQKTEKIDEGYKITLQFTPSKNEPLGMIVFQARILGDSNAKIIDFWPTLNGGPFHVEDDAKEIDSDGKRARLVYSLLLAGQPTFDLTISEKAPVEIQGNYMTNALKILPNTPK
ncbi:hypothetical protein KAX17_06155 [Candidatus Bipolaricaulota bacterium]|nr:hypothetical protein [Candidatus Bipolaricaulota bacterium]